MIRGKGITAILLTGLTIIASGADPDQKETKEQKSERRQQQIAKALKDAEAKFVAATELRSNDIAARRAFRVAVLAYNDVMRLRGETPNLRLMEANACVLGDRIPYAINFYRCGLAADPDNRELMRGLEYARGRVAYSSPEERAALTPKLGIFERVKLHVRRWGVALIAILGATGWFALSRWIMTRKPWMLAIAAPALLATGSLVAIWLVDHSDREAAESVHPQFAVVMKSSVLRSGDGKSFAPVRESPLPMGVEVQILNAGLWSQVQFADGAVGWLPGDCMQRITDGHPFMSAP